MIRTTRTRRFTASVAGVSVLALGLAACSDDSSTDGDNTADGQVTLTVSTFNNFGYTDELLKEYMDANPNVKIEHNVAAKSDDARLNLTTKMAAGGTGLADIEAIEIDWMPELEIVKDSFADLDGVEGIDGRWLDWKEAQGRTTDGKLIGYGTDIGPQAICYRADLFEAAGLDSSREAVAEMIGGEGTTWDSYFAAGEEFAKNSEVPWFDSAGAIWQGMIAQIAEPYENASDGTPKDLAANTEIKTAYDAVLAASEDLSAGLEQWSGDWDAAFQNDGFATMLCPAWMTGAIEERAGGVEGWDVADVFPGGGANWGGSFLTVPAAGENVEEAKKLAAWLTSPETQVKAFGNSGAFPSQVEVLSSPEILAATNEFMSGAPVGEIFSNRAQSIDPATLPYKGANYFKINSAVSDALKRVDVEKTDDAAASWDKAVNAFNELGIM
ncbi:ABC transporter substrate-binding protein [Jonesia quinghaiensis]|uniref:ABC transporter substrate-binding protein n=1 Tax=Jonesia quinghaiensis TaxID=262806 RepID=UPI00048DCF7B|nr:extracellular solute-binding protein [Jonesia quinghaiensis]